MHSDHIDWTSAVALIGMSVVMVVWCSVCTALVMFSNWRASAADGRLDRVTLKAHDAMSEVKVLKAAVLQAQADGQRRTERWRIAHHELYQWALQEGLLANWKRDLPQDTEFSDLSDTIPGEPSASAI